MPPGMGLGLRLTTQAADVVRDNTAEGNGRYGIYAQGAQGNLFQTNLMLAVADLRGGHKSLTSGLVKGDDLFSLDRRRHAGAELEGVRI